MRQFGKQLMAGLCALALTITAGWSVRAEDNPARMTAENVRSDAAVLMDVQTGQILFEKNMDKQEYPASITKILTAILVLENTGRSGNAMVTAEALNAVDPASTHIALTYDEEVPVQDLLYAMMMMSANDAANVLAVHEGGSLGSFVEQMNDKAALLGANSSHFVNPNGLYDPGHYTTARDMAVITRYALGVEGFRDAFGKIQYEMPPTNKQPQARVFYTQSAMMNPTLYRDESVEGAKLGWTDESKHTMVTVAKRGDRELLCVVMNSTQKYDKYKDTQELLDYGFNCFIPVSFTTGELGGQAVPITVSGQEIGSAVVRVPMNYTVYVLNGVQRDKIQISYDLPRAFDGLPKEGAYYAVFGVSDVPGMYAQLGRLPVILDVSDEVKANAAAKMTVSAPQKGWPVWLVAGLGVVGVLVLFVGVLLLIRAVNLSRRKRRRRNRRVQQLGNFSILDQRSVRD